MDRMLEMPVNMNAEAAFKEKKFTLAAPLLMTFSRMALLIAFQCCFWLLFLLIGRADPWHRAAAYWPFAMVLTNIACVLLLSGLLKREGSRFRDFFAFQKGTVIKDILISLGLLAVTGTLGFMPSILLGNWFFGDVAVANRLFYQQLPQWAVVAQLALFPLSMPFGELTTYFGYSMPRLQLAAKNKALAVFLPALMLSLQHAALPLLFDLNGMYMLWAGLKFLLFAFALAFVIRWRPRLFPYLLIGHFLIDIGTAAMFFVPM